MDVLFYGDVASREHGGAIEIIAQGAAHVFKHVGDDDFGPVEGEEPGHRLAESPCSACDQRNLTLQPAIEDVTDMELSVENSLDGYLRIIPPEITADIISYTEDLFFVCRSFSSLSMDMTVPVEATDSLNCWRPLSEKLSTSESFF